MEEGRVARALTPGGARVPLCRALPAAAALVLSPLFTALASTEFQLRKYSRRAPTLVGPLQEQRSRAEGQLPGVVGTALPAVGRGRLCFPAG